MQTFLLLLLCFVLPLLSECQVQVKKVYAIPSGANSPAARFLLCGRDNTMWFNNGDAVASFGPTGEYKEYNVHWGDSSTVLEWMSMDAKGNIWVSVAAPYSPGAHVVSILYADGTLQRIGIYYQPISWLSASASDDFTVWFAAGPLLVAANATGVWHTLGTPGNICGVTLGPDMNIWFEIQAVNTTMIGKLDPKSATVQYYPATKTDGACLLGQELFNAPNGNLWYSLNKQLYQMNTSGAYSSISSLSYAFQVFSVAGNVYDFGTCSYGVCVLQYSPDGSIKDMNIAFDNPKSFVLSSLVHRVNVCPNGQFAIPLVTNDSKKWPTIAIVQLP